LAIYNILTKWANFTLARFLLHCHCHGTRGKDVLLQQKWMMFANTDERDLWIPCRMSLPDFEIEILDCFSIAFSWVCPFVQL
jgi:hypothetical protein